MEQHLANFKNCLQKEVPFCAASCPFHLDIPDFIEKVKRGSFKGAFKVYRDAAGFPVIASALCHEPCKAVCPRKDTDSPVELLLLEKACIAHTADRSPTDYNLPAKKQKVAVIGAGISGLACALRLCMKKYQVEIFDKTDRIGGSLWELMKPEIFLSDIEEQFRYENYALHLNTEIHSAEELNSYSFDAVYVATGTGGEDFGLLSPIAEAPEAPETQSTREATEAPGTSQVRETSIRYCALREGVGWFAGGGLIGEEPVYALANGLYMGTVIDNFLKTGTLQNPANEKSTKARLDPAKLKREDLIVPKDGVSYTQEEAKKEAARCLECQCDFCRSYCDLTDFYNKWPLRMRDEILATTLPGSADVKATPAKRLLSTCSQCGLCKEVCPEEIDLCGLILEGRKSMHRQEKVPWVFHDFWVRDMEFANSELAAISKAPGESCSYAFFPGCQLPASEPGLVEKTYEHLLKQQPDTGLILRCCGVPAQWAGDEEKYMGELSAIRLSWEGLGKPTLIMACPTCEKKIKTHLPEIPVISLYEIIACRSAEGFEAWDAAGGQETASGRETAGLRPAHSVFDACSARHEKAMKEAVRALARRAGYSLESLPLHDSFEQCCSFGGQPGIANPRYAEFVVKKRIQESTNPYITYCINCRDAFLSGGKEAVHILDILFGSGKAPEKLATVSERRENRVALKEKLMKRYWNTEMEEHKTDEVKRGKKSGILISGELKEQLSRERILLDDVTEVLDFCERTGRKIFHPERGTYSGYREIGYMTCWIEYKAGPEAGSFELINAYAHRMQIRLEPVWNGRKTDLDQ